MEQWGNIFLTFLKFKTKITVYSLELFSHDKILATITLTPFIFARHYMFYANFKFASCQRFGQNYPHNVNDIVYMCICVYYSKLQHVGRGIVSKDVELNVSGNCSYFRYPSCTIE